MLGAIATLVVWLSACTSATGRDTAPRPQVETGSSAPAPAIDLMSFNIRYGTASDGVSAKAARLTGQTLSVACPRCESNNTECVSQFGSTPCKAAWRCRDCLEPFDYFKCI